VVTNWLFATETFHYHVWNINGSPTGLNGNITLGSLGSWSVAMRDLLNASSAAVRTQLIQGAFYRGFITIDAVAEATALNPRQPGYPFSNDNALEGFIYYTRLSQGSANGLAMVPLEAISGTVNNYLRGFYGSSDLREEIDSTARECAQQLVIGGDCPPAGSDSDIDRFHMRVFRSTPLNGSSRGVIFTWVPGLAGGPSTYCDTPSNGCASSYVFRQYDENGGVVQNTAIRLDHVVNVIEGSQITGNQAGWISVLDVPNIILDSQVYAFSFNSAFPSGNPNLTWDAIFEGYIVP
jgi:hypothetical protein